MTENKLVEQIAKEIVEFFDPEVKTMAYQRFIEVKLKNLISKAQQEQRDRDIEAIESMMGVWDEKLEKWSTHLLYRKDNLLRNSVLQDVLNTLKGNKS